MNQIKSAYRGVCAAPVLRSGFLLPALLISCCLAWASPAPAVAQCQYEAVVIEGPQHEWFSAIVIGRGLNDSGAVVGEWRWPIADYPEAFYWTEEKGMLTLPRPAGVIGATASDLNEHGQIVGSHMIEGQGWTGFVFDLETGAFTYLAPKHEGVVAHTVSSANAINNAGIVAGSRVIGEPDDPAPLPYNAVIWDTNTGEVTDLGVMEGPNSEARAINDDGITAGLTGPLLDSFGFRSGNGTVIVLPPLPNGSTSFGNAINNTGMVAGGGQLNDPEIDAQPAIWVDKQWIGLGLLPGAHVGGATSINSHGQVGGSCSSPTRAFFWQHGKMHDLNELSLGANGMESTRAISDAGQILVRAGVKSVLLTPIDVPLGDLNFDCSVDVYDLLILLDQWGPVTVAAPTDAANNWPNPDLNGDGVVNVFDLLILLDNWNP